MLDLSPTDLLAEAQIVSTLVQSLRQASSIPCFTQACSGLSALLDRLCTSAAPPDSQRQQQQQLSAVLKEVMLALEDPRQAVCLTVSSSHHIQGYSNVSGAGLCPTWCHWP